VSRRILICEDSTTYAAGLVRLLERDEEIEVVGVCSTAEQTIARLARNKPDLVTMDLELPGMSGLTAVEQIMSNTPVPILVLSGHVAGQSQTVLDALAAGALDALPKDGLDLRDLDGDAAQALRQRVKTLSKARVIRHPRARLNGRPPAAASPPRRASVIGICASAGGPAALRTLLADLPADFAIPVLVVQHMARGFVDGFARWLDAEVPLPVRLAADRASVAAGVWIAPEGAHLTLDAEELLALDGGDSPPGELHRPSGDVLLASLADTAREQAVAIVLTGMGRDGAAGFGRVRAAGGLTIAQDEATAVIAGMPQAAAERGAELVLPLAEIAPRLRQLTPAVGRAR
jgi:two-component system chemotaxis response regulator CheB